MIKAGLYKRPASFAYHLLWEAIDWLYPPLCGGCGTTGSRWCEQCALNTLPIDAKSVCPSCGYPTKDSSLCFRCKELSSPPPVIIRSYTTYQGPIREAIHRLKYQNDIALCESLAIYLIELFNIYKWEVDLILPVPLSTQRQKERGYNQSTLIARPFSMHFEIPISKKAVIRTSHTSTQVGLSARERQNNLLKAFTAQPSIVSGKKILVIDDVVTTNATMNAIAQALVDAGAFKVYGLTLARSVLQHTSKEEV